MKSLTYLLLSIAFTTSVSAEEFQSLFNGKDLSGWVGKSEFWSVKDGAIFGQTTKEKPTKGNTFLIWEGGEVADFIFKAKVRFSGNNSGVQYRSERFGQPDDFAVKGYQADLHPKPEYFGMLYAEKWRGIVAQRFQKVLVGEDGKPKVIGDVGDKNQKLVDSEWNELKIIAVGNRQIHQVNGVTTMDLTDNHPDAKRKGILALQLHAGKADDGRIQRYRIASSERTGSKGGDQLRCNEGHRPSDPGGSNQSGRRISRRIALLRSKRIPRLLGQSLHGQQGTVARE